MSGHVKTSPGPQNTLRPQRVNVVVAFFMTLGLINFSKRLLSMLVRSPLINGSMGLSVWYNFKNGVISRATIRKKLSFAWKSHLYVFQPSMTTEVKREGCGTSDCCIVLSTHLRFERAFPRSQSVDAHPALKELFSICKPQLPTLSIFLPVCCSMFCWAMEKSFQFTFGPSIDS
ncbi:hypothetical protein M9458_050692 [Cirrhinus mrigala]|uniref:Uncharacterized protein n=1 Tax=Cirrhinus mrigala TaxID=683832 RepID=A0ABD0MXQ9_CIRMR